jgi:hypothetical protein
MTRDSLGEFEHQILLAILRHGGDSYSVPIVTELLASLASTARSFMVRRS